MPDESVVLPFTMPNFFGGFAEGRGLATASPSELKLEFKVQENLLGLVKSGLNEISIPRSEIDVVRFHRGWFRTRLRIRVKSLDCLEDLPGCERGELILHIARRDRPQAENFAHMLGAG